MTPLLRVLRIVAHVMGIIWHIFGLNVVEAGRTLPFSILKYWDAAIWYHDSLLIMTCNQSCSV